MLRSKSRLGDKRGNRKARTTPSGLFAAPLVPSRGADEELGASVAKKKTKKPGPSESDLAARKRVDAVTERTRVTLEDTQVSMAKIQKTVEAYGLSVKRDN